MKTTLNYLTTATYLTFLLTVLFPAYVSPASYLTSISDVEENHHEYLKKYRKEFKWSSGKHDENIFRALNNFGKKAHELTKNQNYMRRPPRPCAKNLLTPKQAAMDHLWYQLDNWSTKETVKEGAKGAASLSADLIKRLNPGSSALSSMGKALKYINTALASKDFEDFAKKVATSKIKGKLTENIDPKVKEVINAIIKERKEFDLKLKSLLDQDDVIDSDYCINSPKDGNFKITYNQGLIRIELKGNCECDVNGENMDNYYAALEGRISIVYTNSKLNPFKARFIGTAIELDGWCCGDEDDDPLTQTDDGPSMTFAECKDAVQALVDADEYIQELEKEIKDPSLSDEEVGHLRDIKGQIESTIPVIIEEVNKEECQEYIGGLSDDEKAKIGKILIYWETPQRERKRVSFRYLTDPNLHFTGVYTGETTGIVAHLTITNHSDQTITRYIGPFYITVYDGYQPYIVTIRIPVEIDPGETVTIPLDGGICVDNSKEPGPPGHEMNPSTIIEVDSDEPTVRFDPPDFSLLTPDQVTGLTVRDPDLTPGSIVPTDPETGDSFEYNYDYQANPLESAPLLFWGTQVINDTYQDLNEQGVFDDDPFANDPVKQEQTYTQNGNWLYWSVMMGDNPFVKDDMATKVEEQFETALGVPIDEMPEQVQEQISTGIDNIWDSIVLIGTIGKVYKEEEDDGYSSETNLGNFDSYEEPDDDDLSEFDPPVESEEDYEEFVPNENEIFINDPPKQPVQMTLEELKVEYKKIYDRVQTLTQQFEDGTLEHRNLLTYFEDRLSGLKDLIEEKGGQVPTYDNPTPSSDGEESEPDLALSGPAVSLSLPTKLDEKAQALADSIRKYEKLLFLKYIEIHESYTTTSATQWDGERNDLVRKLRDAIRNFILYFYDNDGINALSLELASLEAELKTKGQTLQALQIKVGIANANLIQAQLTLQSVQNNYANLDAAALIGAKAVAVAAVRTAEIELKAAEDEYHEFRAEEFVPLFEQTESVKSQIDESIGPGIAEVNGQLSEEGEEQTFTFPSEDQYVKPDDKNINVEDNFLRLFLGPDGFVIYDQEEDKRSPEQRKDE